MREGGRFFEDFRLGEELRHATPRTLTVGDAALYQALYGSRFAVPSSDEFARTLGYPRAPLDDLLVFHMVFGKTVPDVSLNAVANLGYAAGRFLKPVFAGETLTATSQVIGLRENASRETGVIYVRSRGLDAAGDVVLDYTRWVMVRKRDKASPAPEPHVPDLPEAVAADSLGAALPPQLGSYDFALAGSDRRFGDCAPGERIDHVDGMTIEEAEHQMATRLFQNTARVHFDALGQRDSRFGRRLVYGGHIISLARALSFNGLANAFHIAAINGGRHVAPCFAGDTIYAWSEVLEACPAAGRPDVGFLRLRAVATKDKPCDGFPMRDPEGRYDPAVVLDFDYWAAMPR